MRRRVPALAVLVASVLAVLGVMPAWAAQREVDRPSPSTVPDPAGAPATSDDHPSIDVDGAGNVHIAFTRTAGIRPGLYYVTDKGTGPWTSVRLTTSPYDEFPEIHVDAAGKVHIVWWRFNFDGGNNGLFYITNASGSWVRRTLVASDSVQNGFASGVTPSGRLHVFANVAQTYRHITNRTGSWVNQALFSGTNDRWPDLAITSTGKLDVVFIGDPAFGGQGLWYATDRGGSSPWQADLLAGTVYPDGPSIDLDGDDNVHVIYTWTLSDTPPGVFYVTNASGDWFDERLTDTYDINLDLRVLPDGSLAYTSSRHVPAFPSGTEYQQILTRVDATTIEEFIVADGPDWKGVPALDLAADGEHIVHPTTLYGRQSLEYLAPTEKGWAIAIDDLTPLDTAGTFRIDIDWLIESGITAGCAPNFYCPNDPVTREQMASFLARALNLPPTATDFFTDDETSTHEQNINRLATAGITTGCGPGKFCPAAPVARDQMASFLARALALPTTATDFFTDDEGNTHEININRLRASGITTGCSPTTYCPSGIVTRGQMAAFLHRAFDE